MHLNSYDVTLAADGVDLDKALEAGEYTTHRVTPLHPDQLLGEQAGPRYGLGPIADRPMAYVTLWCWAALHRTGVEVGEFPPFKARVLSVDLVKEAPVAVDPTTPGPDTDSP